MNRNEQLDNLDRILLNHDSLLPSSGFAASVMDAIQQQATAPAPIPFPWKRALPGIIAMLAALAFLGRFLATSVDSLGRSPAAGTDWLTWLQSSATLAVILRTQAAPVLLVLAVSWVCVVLCSRLAGGWSVR